MTYYTKLFTDSIQGRLSESVIFYKKACLNNEHHFYSSYVGIFLANYFDSDPTIIPCYAYILKNKKIVAYIKEYANLIFAKSPPLWLLLNAVSGDCMLVLYISCAFAYQNFNQAQANPSEQSSVIKKYLANAAIQHFLLAFHYGTHERKADIVFGGYLKDGHVKLDVIVFENIFGLLSPEQLDDVKSAYMEWMDYDITIQCRDAVSIKLAVLEKYNPSSLALGDDSSATTYEDAPPNLLTFQKKRESQDEDPQALDQTSACIIN